VKYNKVGCTLEEVKSVIDNCAEAHVYKSKGRAHKNLHSRKRGTCPFEQLYVDIKVMLNNPSYSGKRYKLIVVDDFSRYKKTILLNSKDELPSELEKWISTFVVSRKFKVCRILADNAKESKSKDMDNMCIKHGIEIQYTDTYSSPSNGVAERAIQTCQYTEEALRNHAGFPKQAWAECSQTADLIENLLNTRANGNDFRSPYEIVNGKPPDVSYLRTIGCRAFVHASKPHRNAQADRAREGRLIGYSQNSRCYRILMNATTGEIVETESVTFIEALGDNSYVNTLPGFVHNESDFWYTDDDTMDTHLMNMYINTEQEKVDDTTITEDESHDDAIENELHGLLDTKLAEEHEVQMVAKLTKSQRLKASTNSLVNIGSDV
jgi:hypothetical protein